MNQTKGYYMNIELFDLLPKDEDRVLPNNKVWCPIRRVNITFTINIKQTITYKTILGILYDNITDYENEQNQVIILSESRQNDFSDQLQTLMLINTLKKLCE